jgi:hypothetical protein
MAPKQHQPPGTPITLGNMREQGVHHPIAGSVLIPRDLS